MYVRVQRIEDQLKELINWIKLANRPMLRELLAKELDTEEKKRIYELTDGTRSQYEIEGLTKVTRRMVGYYWQKWSALGLLVASDQRKGRMQKIIALSDIGMNIITPNERTENISGPEFESKNLEEILFNQRLFPAKEQIYDFSSSILNLPSIGYQNMARSELVDIVINSFEKADKIKQNLFLQALERRAIERQTTEFSKFFDAWARQIGK